VRRRTAITTRFREDATRGLGLSPLRCADEIRRGTPLRELLNAFAADLSFAGTVLPDLLRSVSGATNYVRLSHGAPYPLAAKCSLARCQDGVQFRAWRRLSRRSDFIEHAMRLDIH
jgi:hypothetical protein